MDLQRSPQPNVLGRGSNKKIEFAGLNSQIVKLYVVKRELLDRQAGAERLCFTRLQGNTLKSPEGFDGLIGKALLLVRVELSDLRTSQVSCVAQVKRHLSFTLRSRRVQSDLQIAIAEPGVTEAMPKGIKRHALEILVSKTFADVVLVLWRHAIEVGVHCVRHTSAGVIHPEQCAGHGVAAHFARIPRFQNGR